MTTNAIRDALALVVVDYFDEALFLTDENNARTSRDLVDDLERAVHDVFDRVVSGIKAVPR